jgi:2-dehydro-3-deoxygluconokinase
MSEILKIRPASETKWDCASLRRSYAAVRSRLRARAYGAQLPGLGRRRRIQCSAAMRKCWGKRATVVTALPQNDLGWLALDLMWQGGVDSRISSLARIRRHRPQYARRPQLHREGLRRARGARMLGPRPLGRLADQAGRSELGEAVRRGRRAVVPHRRHLRRPGAQHRRIVIEAVEAAHKYGTIVSYDLNLSRLAVEVARAAQRAAVRR